jgi:hypothetical protein
MELVNRSLSMPVFPIRLNKAYPDGYPENGSLRFRLSRRAGTQDAV